MNRIWNAILTFTIDGMPWWRGLIVYTLFITAAVVYAAIVYGIVKPLKWTWRKAHFLTLDYWHLVYPMAWWN